MERESRRLTDGSVFYVVDGKLRFNQGYLQRQCAISSLRICETLPPLDELQRFKQASSLGFLCARLILPPLKPLGSDHQTTYPLGIKRSFDRESLQFDACLRVHRQHRARGMRTPRPATCQH